MTTLDLELFFGYCTLINFSILMVWFLMIVFLKDFVYNLHSKWFKIDRDRFDEIHYKFMAFFKLLVIVFNLVPYLVTLLLN